MLFLYVLFFVNFSINKCLINREYIVWMSVIYSVVSLFNFRLQNNYIWDLPGGRVKHRHVRTIVEIAWWRVFIQLHLYVT